MGMVEALLGRGADPNAGREGKPKAIHHAAGHNDAESVKRLLKAGADWAAESETGQALHWAAGEGAKAALQVGHGVRGVESEVEG